MEELLAAWRDDPSLPPAERLERFVRFHVRLSLERAEAVFLSYTELRNLSPANFAEIARPRRAYEDALQAILEAGQAAGVMRLPDARPTATALISMLTGVTHWYREGGRYDRARIESIDLDLVRGAVGA